MPELSSQIKKLLREKDKMVLSGGQAILGILKDLQKQVIEELGAAALTSWDVYQLKKYLNAIESKIAEFESRAKKETAGLLDEAWKTGVAVVDAPFVETGIYLGVHLSTSVLDAMKDFATNKIKDVSNYAWGQIRGELTLGILGGKTPQQVANSIGVNLKESGIFKNVATRAEVITKLEMGRVFSQATQLRMEQTSEHVSGLEKQWVHAGHPKKARPTHVAAHGDHVPVDQPFNIGGVKMMFPRAPEAPLEEVIN